MTIDAPYTAAEWMAVVAAREIKDGEVVFVGTGLPMLAAMLAKRTHAPDCVIVFEAGGVDPRMNQLPMSVGDSRTIENAAMASGLFDVFNYLLQGGRIDIGFLGGAQVDRYGNINSTAIGNDYLRPKVRLPGSGGGADVAIMSQRTVIMARHELRRLPEKVDFITSPGWLEGNDSRAAAGIPHGGPAALVTTLGLIRYRDITHEPFLASVRPGIMPSDVRTQTGFALDIDVPLDLPEPSTQEIEILRRDVDPHKIFLS